MQVECGAIMYPNDTWWCLWKCFEMIQSLIDSVITRLKVCIPFQWTHSTNQMQNWGKLLSSKVRSINSGHPKGGILLKGPFLLRGYLCWCIPKQVSWCVCGAVLWSQERSHLSTREGRAKPEYASNQIRTRSWPFSISTSRRCYRELLSR